MRQLRYINDDGIINQEVIFLDSKKKKEGGGKREDPPGRYKFIRNFLLILLEMFPSLSCPACQEVALTA